MYELVLCWAYVFPMCGHIDRLPFKTYEECDRERVVQMAMKMPPYSAVCWPKVAKVEVIK